jgi:glycogen debranching enzyme
MVCMSHFRPLRTLLLASTFLTFLLTVSVAQEASPALALSRSDRPWEFLSAVGTRAGVFGDESGRVEAWVYPLKILKNFHLQFDVEGRLIPAETLARTVIAHSESCTILYTGDTFAVRETFFVPIREAGAVVALEIESADPLNVRVAFERDFQLEWPAALGGTYANWDPKLRAFAFGEEQKKFSALIGSPTAANERLEYRTNSSSSNENSFDLGATSKRKETRVIVIAGSPHSHAEAEATYQVLSTNYPSLMKESADYYQAYLKNTVNLELPDSQLQQAYDWSRISILQGLVDNPFLGKGLIAGYRTSGNDQRPGFAWFFGRDSIWTSFALNAEGDYATTRTALDFISKFQRDDGKIPHEISQTASLVDWFKNYPYAFASADATPLYIIGINDYVTASGDLTFAQQKWDSLWKAYQFLNSTYDSRGVPRNLGIGHGWVEGGPLLPVESELYQSALGAEAQRSLSNIAQLIGKTDISSQLSAEFSKQEQALNQTFWLSDKKRFAFALDINGKPVDEPSVLATVPMWFGLLDEEKTVPMISELASAGHQTDWGMRIISSESPKYGAGGYHYGAVWPLFTGWASVGEYRYHQALPAYLNLRANALLALDGSLGHVAEVLSGDYYQPLSTNSPHQIWSAAMVVSPILRGMLGLSTDANSHTLIFAPHVPSDWSTFTVNNIHVGSCVLDLRYHKTDTEITLQTSRSGPGDCNIEFSPSVSFLAEVTGAEMSGHSVLYRVVKTASDHHVKLNVAVPAGQSELRIKVRNDFGLSFNSELPPLGSSSRGLRLLIETWSPAKDRLDLDVEGTSGSTYELAVFNAPRDMSVEGAELVKTDTNRSTLKIAVPSDAPDIYRRLKVVFHFSGKRSMR